MFKYLTSSHSATASLFVIEVDLLIQFNVFNMMIIKKKHTQTGEASDCAKVPSAFCLQHHRTLYGDVIVIPLTLL